MIIWTKTRENFLCSRLSNLVYVPLGVILIPSIDNVDSRASGLFLLGVGKQ